MADRQGKPLRTKAQIMQDIDGKLPALPREQQNLVAAYAQGIRTGLVLRARLAAELPAPGPPRPPKP